MYKDPYNSIGRMREAVIAITDAKSAYWGIRPSSMIPHIYPFYLRRHFRDIHPGMRQVLQPLQQYWNIFFRQMQSFSERWQKNRLILVFMVEFISGVITEPAWKWEKRLEIIPMKREGNERR